eukprot:scaffold136017_cov30-Tisochrysis_lutea.AAC.3
MVHAIATNPQSGHSLMLHSPSVMAIQKRLRTSATGTRSADPTTPCSQRVVLDRGLGGADRADFDRPVTT